MLCVRISRISEDAICPISQQVMEDPVVCADGHSYERAFIQKWLAPLGKPKAPHERSGGFFCQNYLWGLHCYFRLNVIVLKFVLCMLASRTVQVLV